MTTRRTGTIAVAAIVFVVGLFAGFKMLTSRADTGDPAPTCETRTVAKGEPLTSNVVTVNVFNASKRSGLANRVSIDLQRNGFLGGGIGNSTSAAKPAAVTILTSDPDDPQVKLIAAQFQDKVAYAAPDIAAEEGVVVVIGDTFTKLKGKPALSIVAGKDVSTCVPVVQLS